MLPVTAITLAIPAIFHSIGRNAEFTQLLLRFLLFSLPLYILQGLMYPLQSLLIAQQHTIAILVMSCMGFLAHIVANHVFVALLGMEVIGSACSLLSTYIV